MLMHHADAQGIGVVGVIDFHHLAILFDHAGFRLVQAEQDTHQRGFPRAVLTQQGMDLSPLQLQGHVVVGLDAGKLLGDVQHFNHVVRHMVTPHRFYFFIIAPFLKKHNKNLFPCFVFGDVGYDICEKHLCFPEYRHITIWRADTAAPLGSPFGRAVSRTG